ncbi:MAG: SIMPL domain-containing protein [Pseudanabaenaceae cyanobacterium bins.68]|nr:SIMPL domain-containing protein [Pseudanabaenaceae cyanobacterium bins.68]
MNNSAKTDGFPQVFWGMVAMAIAVTVGAILGSSALGSLRTSDSLTIIGSAKRPIQSNYVVWQSSVSAQQPTLQQAYQAVKRHSERVQGYLKSQNIGDESISLGAIATEAIPEYVNGNATGKILSYKLTQRFEVSSKDVSGIAKVARSSTDLINEGIPYASEPPQYLYTDLTQLRVEMVAEAAKDAKSRADAIASVTGSKVGVVRRAETDAFQITPRFSTEVSSGGVYNTTTIDKDIKAVVSITFAVD